MPSNNRIIICAAGGGKTSLIVDEALARADIRIGMTTYTNNNHDGITSSLIFKKQALAPHITTSTWFSFLLKEAVRPYQRSVYKQSRVVGIHWVKGKSTQGIPATSIRPFYFYKGSYLYSDKVSQFACACNIASNGAVFARLKERFDVIYIDEVQDLAGYDLVLIEEMMKAGVPMVLVGDHRQSTYQTNHSGKYKQYAGYGIIGLFKIWEKKGLCALVYETHSYRCNPAVAAFSDQFFPEEPKTESRNETITEHDGIFVISSADLPKYVETYKPQSLRYDKSTLCSGYPAMNLGASKGLTFDRVLIHPSPGCGKWLKTGSIKHVIGSREKWYVGITRARQSVTFVYDGEIKVPGITHFKFSC
ncbi:UvrD-helicase domain-containing protein [Rhizobium laguerreae]|uniref:UvrD-helicase domain-containing protein n=1 Tax=Rhizobium laguerreae TaxID=1076926 RepID=UPI001441C53D|nr:UvrD-helicase domain-containing protein [Rhizobium laguerreae]NKM69923.1 AAA family ATPase [Rhizobium laguerreae]